jgi:hypothetical protein
MNATSEDIKDLLEAESSLGLTGGTNLFIGREQPTPDNCVTIFDTSSRPPQTTLEEEGATLNYDSVQIRVRNRSYEDGWSLIKALQIALHGRAGETWNDTLYSAILCQSGPAWLDFDDNNRVRFIVNINVIRR